MVNCLDWRVSNEFYLNELIRQDVDGLFPIG